MHEMMDIDKKLVEIPDSNAELEAALTAQAVEIAELKKANKVKEDQINALTELVNTFGNKVNELLNEKNGK